VRTTDAIANLRRLNRPVLETGEVVARLDVPRPRASQMLKEMDKAGLVTKLRHGLWLLDSNLDPFAVAPYLTAPYPAYISFSSALGRHGMIEQIPRQIFVATLDRPSKIETPVGTYSIHHLAPEVFGGFEGSARTGYLATPEKALFDAVYLPSARQRNAYLPELELPATFNADAAFAWTDAIGAGWLRTKVRQALERLIAGATTAS
jgi:predicted transcriptional regulator of viral defense system